MIDHFSILVRDMAASSMFYDTVLQPLGGRRLMDFGEAIGYGKDKPDFWLAALTGDAGFRENHIAFAAPDRAAVKAFFDAAVGLGAEMLHEPRLWPEYHDERDSTTFASIPRCWSTSHVTNRIPTGRVAIIHRGYTW